MSVFNPWEIARDIDIVDLIGKKYGLEVNTHGRVMFASCPRVGDGDTTPSLAIYPDQKRFHCYHCGNWGGTAIDFVMGVEGFDTPLAALRHLDKLYPQLGIVSAEGRERAEAVGRYYAWTEKLVREDRQRLKQSKRYTDWVRKERGLSEMAFDQFSIGVRDFNGVPRLVIPQFGNNGQVLAFVTRQMSPIDKMGRYQAKNVSLNPKTGMMIKKGDVVEDPIAVFRKGSYLYNLARIKGTRVFIVDGHLDVVAAWELGVTDFAAMGTTVLTDGQAELLYRFNEVVIVPDLNSLDKVISNVEVVRMQHPRMPMSVLDLRGLSEWLGEKDKDVNDALIRLTAAGEVERFEALCDTTIPAETWLYDHHVRPVKNDQTKAFAQLQRVLDIATQPVARVALATLAGEDLSLPADLLYR